MVLRPSIAKPRFSSSRSKTLANPPNPHFATQTLQLWVQHSLNLSARSSILVAKLNANHASAKTDQLAASVNNLMPPSSKGPSPLTSSSRLSVSRDLEKRHALRTLRRYRLQSILRAEEQKRLEEQRLAQQAALQAEQQAAQRAAQQAAQEAAQQAAREAAEQKQRQALASQQPNDPIPHASNAVPQRDQKPVRRVSFGKVSIVGEAAPLESFVINQEDVKTAKQQSKSHVAPHLENLLPVAEQALKVWKQVSEEADGFRQNFAVKKIRLSLKKRINLGVNQIAASVKQVSTKVRDLSGLIYETKSAAGPQGEAFVMKEVAQRLIKESDGSVSLNQTAAFAVAAVIVGIAASVPEVARMRDVFLGAFYDHCMFTVPAYARRRMDESLEDYRTRIGYKEEETADSFLERMCGCVSLFAAVLQTEQVHVGSNFGVQAQNPFSLDLGWAWLARIVNMEQKGLTPAVVYAFLETAGYGMAKRYRKQFAKLIAMVQHAVVLNAVKSAPKGPVTRLDLFISEFISDGCTIRKAPEGRTLPLRDAENL